MLHHLQFAMNGRCTDPLLLCKQAREDFLVLFGMRQVQLSPL